MSGPIEQAGGAMQYSRWQKKSVKTHVVSTKPSSHTFKSVQAAVNAASVNERVVILEGTYVETVVIDKSVEIIGQANLSFNAVLIKAPTTIPETKESAPSGSGGGGGGASASSAPATKGGKTSSSKAAAAAGSKGAKGTSATSTSSPSEKSSASGKTSEQDKEELQIEKMAVAISISKPDAIVHFEGVSFAAPTSLSAGMHATAALKGSRGAGATALSAAKEANAAINAAASFALHPAEVIRVTAGKATFTNCHFSSLKAAGAGASVEVSNCYVNIASAMINMTPREITAFGNKIPPGILFDQGASGYVHGCVITPGELC